MAHIPSAVDIPHPGVSGLTRRHQGKVRDSYEIPSRPDLMLVVASNRVSVFDFVLPGFIKMKGQILNALNHFTAEQVLSGICPTDIVAAGINIDHHLPAELRGNAELQKVATVVRILPAPDVEDIVRFHLTGTGLKSYLKTGAVCGHSLPKDLRDGSELPYPIYTPTTKAPVGHDEHITADSVAERYGVKRERLALQLAQAIYKYAKSRGVILADTKFELTLDNGTWYLVDERGTPDSSRYWRAADWLNAFPRREMPQSFDKQHVRNWAIEAGVQKRPNGRERQTTDDADLAFVDGLTIPQHVADETTRLYRYIFWRLTGSRIEKYQFDHMGIMGNEPGRTVEVVLGSRNDFDQYANQKLLIDCQLSGATVRFSILSCHRNPDDLRQFAREHLVKADAVVAGAGLAAALPGIIKSELCMLKRPDIPVIGVAFPGKTGREAQAARLSIECLPGKPVELDPNGETYFGEEGLRSACLSAANDEFLPKALAAKPAEIHFATGSF